ncbi:MAG: hypothetical protein EPN97_09750 [Alphaproteobacteria bacterium]|nr:MAG: hypothetical protein EPN97_09750 [Alphaproteobacteria bacterium]
MQKDISHIFGRFAGREVPLTETKTRMKVAGKPYELKEYSAAPNDPVLQELRQEADRFGLSLRIWWPGMVATMELNPDRLNVHIRKDNDGKWRISDDISTDASQKLRETFASIVARGVDKDVPVLKPLRLKPPGPV